MGRLIKRVGAGIVMFAFTAWGVIKNALMMIGASTVPEDAQVLVNDKWPAIARWFVDTPEWSGPLALFVALALAAWLVWPQSAVAAPTADVDQKAPTPTQQPLSKADEATTAKQVAATMAAPTGALLGAPLASTPLAAAATAPPHFWWKALPPVDEGADKNAAKKKIVQLTRRFLDKALFQQVHFYAAARDAFTGRYSNSPLRNALVRGLDMARDGESRPVKGFFTDLQNPDAVAAMTLHEATTNYYHQFINYVRGIQLTADLIAKAPLPGAVPENIRTKHDAWRLVHDEMMAEHKRLANEDLYLDLLRTMSEQPALVVPEFDFGPKANP